MTLRSQPMITSEAVQLDLRFVGLPARTLARALDIAIQIAVWVVVYLVGLVVFFDNGMKWEAIVVWSTTALVVLLGYPIAMESATRGRTVGKMAAGLRTVTVEGLPISFRHAAIRGIFDLVDLWLTFGAVGVATITWSERHQRSGDMAAGTVVVLQRSPAAVASLYGVHFAVPPGMEQLAAALDVSGLPVELHELVRSYLTRWREIEPIARSQIGLGLADQVAGSIAFTPSPSVTPDLFLATVAACYQSRFSRDAGPPGEPTPGRPPAPPNPTTWPPAGPPGEPTPGRPPAPPNPTTWPPAGPPAPS